MSRRSHESDIAREVARLESMPMADLKERYAEVFSEPCRSGNRRHLVRRIAWQVQAIREGGLTERALRRAEALADDADLRVRPPKGLIDHASRGRTVVAPMTPRDPRLPSPGTVIRRVYKGRALLVTVLDDGFEFGGQRYRSLGAVARKVTGSAWNGMRFFGLTAAASTTGKGARP